MKRTQAITLAFVTLAMTGIMAACSAPQEAASTTVDLSSRDLSGSATKPLANCNSVTMAQLKFNTMIYRDSAGTTHYDLLQGKIQNMVETFRNGTEYVRFFRWKVDSDGTYYQDPIPLQVRVHAEDTGQAITNYQDFIRWDMVSAYAASRGLSGSAANFFTRVRILMDVRDPYADYDAITIAYYDGSNTLLAQANMLIPTFYANPSDYATDPAGYARSTLLTALHPFAAQTGLTAANYQTMANNFCY